LTFFDESPVRVGQRLRLRHGAEVAVRVDEGAVHQVAPRGDKLVVVAAHELVIREVRVLVLRPGDHQVVAESVRVVPVEEIADKDQLPTPPGSGAGTPQSRSRVIARCLRLRTSSSEYLRTWGRQFSWCSIHSASWAPNAGRSKKKCSVSRISTGASLPRWCGLMRSVGSSWLPQLSHWSPRASGNLQIGHLPSMYRSGSVRPAFGSNAPICVFFTR